MLSWSRPQVLAGGYFSDVVAGTLEGADKESWDSCQHFLEGLGVPAEDADKHLRKVRLSLSGCCMSLLVSRYLVRIPPPIEL